MAVPDAVLVLGGGAIGAPVRYLTERAVQRRHETVFPWGTITVNIIGTLVLGLLTVRWLPRLPHTPSACSSESASVVH